MNSLDNEYSDFSEEENSDKRRKSDKNKLITLLSLSVLRSAKLNSNKASKAKLHKGWSKRSSVIKKRKKKNVKKYQCQALQNSNLGDIFAKLQKKSS